MSFNYLMHPRNIYRIKPDYLKLGEKYPSFKDLLVFYKNGKAKLNFNDPKALKILTTTLLENDFNLKVDLPSDRLIPTVPQRLNYVLWIEDLLGLLDLPPHQSIFGIDLGTGSCCIFPLLGCTTNRSWSFLATEADEVSHQFAVNNVLNNQMSHRIKVIKVTPDMFLLNLPSVNGLEAHFLMCNPPFFNDRSYDDSEFDGDEPMSEKQSFKKTSKSPSPSNSSVLLESVTSGGEVEFVKKIIKESLILKESIKIDSVMLGHKKSSVILSQHLKGIAEIKDVTINQFFQGRTMRWGLAWTFLDNLRLSESTKFAEMKRLHKKKNSPYVYTIPKNLTSIHYSLQSIYRRIRQLLRDELEITTVDIIRESNHSIEMIIQSQRNAWSHQRRRKRMLSRVSNEKISETNQIDLIGNQISGDLMETDTMSNIESPSGTASTQSDESFTNDSSGISELDENSSSGKRKAESINLEEEETNFEEWKKIRDERQIKTITKEEELYLLHCSLTIKRTENDFISLEMRTKEKAKSKDATNQLLTFFRNNLN